MSAKPEIVVIGNGMVGHRFLESLAQNETAEFNLTVFCEEPRVAYDRVHLSEFFTGRSVEELSMARTSLSYFSCVPLFEITVFA